MKKIHWLRLEDRTEELEIKVGGRVSYIYMIPSKLGTLIAASLEMNIVGV